MVTINPDICKGCELCVTACPKNCIALNGEIMNSKGYHPADLAKREDCILCGFCATMCPDCAITITEKKEAA
ncbi:MAG: 4Fe-4S binding protein [Oscillospiraceae bacterium]|jgi:2-oxoglutarate ferredoxin oxidoreductase subunit delta|nr:4Fe-4S binding protein [Oscillospiraceae bacterium]